MSSSPIRKAKWIAGASPDQNVVETARLALASRLSLVCYYLPLAARNWEDDIEYVHQLRVTTRRSVAVLDVFGHLLSERHERWLRRRLNKIRRSAGDARDYDVQLARLEVWAGTHPDRDVVPVADWLVAQRRAAQAPIVARYEKLAQKNFSSRIEEIIQRVGRKARPKKSAQLDLDTAARQALWPVVDDFFTEAGACSGKDRALHRLRIEGKRLRYAIELLAAAFPASLRKEVYPAVEALQQKLGAVNDHATAARQYRKWAEQADAATHEIEVPAPLLRDWADEEDAALCAARVAFSNWWTDEREQCLRQQLGAIAGNK